MDLTGYLFLPQEEESEYTHKKASKSYEMEHFDRQLQYYGGGGEEDKHYQLLSKRWTLGKYFLKNRVTVPNRGQYIDLTLPSNSS